MLNGDLRRQIVNMVVAGNNGHIPSAFSIVDIITHLYDQVLKVDYKKPNWEERDIFILSKGARTRRSLVINLYHLKPV